ncbi:hypothetical protein Tco_0717946 [Tanacetum coccineum]
MLATGRYAQWRSRFLRYIDTRPNGDALRKVHSHSHYESDKKNAIPLMNIDLRIGDEIYSMLMPSDSSRKCGEAIERFTTKVFNFKQSNLMASRQDEEIDDTSWKHITVTWQRFKRTSNANAVCATCGKCVFNSNHDACVSKFLNDVNARTKKPNVVPISTRKPKSQANKSVATPHKKTVASESTITSSKSYYRMLYKKTSKAWKWWIAQQCRKIQMGFLQTQKKWFLRSKSIGYQSIGMKVCLKRVSFAIVQLILFIVDSGCTKHMTGNVSLLCNFVEKYLGTVRFGNDQFAPILGYGDLVQGNITIKRVYYVEGLNHNLFSVGQFCDADLEVAFRKSTCFVRDLQGNRLHITG